MALNNPQEGIGSVSAYLSPGLPWVSGSVAITDGIPTKFKFSAVTRFFIVGNTGANPVRVGFTAAGVSGSGATNFFTVNTGTVQQFDLRVRDVFVAGEGGASTIDLLGGLTSIPRTNYPNLTGSNPAPDGSAYLPNIE